MKSGDHFRLVSWEAAFEAFSPIEYYGKTRQMGSSVQFDPAVGL